MLKHDCATLSDPGKADVWGDSRCSSLGQRLGLCVRIANDEEALWSLGEAAATRLETSELTALVWNVQKGMNEKWDADMAALAASADIALLQEFAGDAPTEQTLDSVDGFQWVFAASFFDGAIPTGVATGGLIQPTNAQFHRSPDVEPVLLTPKMALCTTYALSWSEEELLVINVHAINFRTTGAFENQIDQLSSRIATHKGPAIVAGDFNTWWPSRRTYLDAEMASHGFEHVSLEGEGNHPVQLDHVYVRGIDVHTAALLTNHDTSDHAPISVEMNITH